MSSTAPRATCPTSPSRPTTPSSPPACRCRSGPRRGTTRSRRPSWRRTATLFTLGGQSEDVTGCSFYEGHVAFSPDGTLLASSSHDFTVQVTPLADPDATTVLAAAPRHGLRRAVLARRHAAADDVRRRLDAGVAGRRLEAARRVPRRCPAATSRWRSAPDGHARRVRRRPARSPSSTRPPAPPRRTFDGTRAVLGDMAFTPDGRRLLAPLPTARSASGRSPAGQQVGELVGHTMPVNGDRRQRRRHARRDVVAGRHRALVAAAGRLTRALTPSPGGRASATDERRHADRQPTAA